MIAKILTQSKTFSAIAYNEKKVEKNLGSFIEAYNFGYLDVLENKTIKDYERYFEQWGEKNKNIKNKQFHVSISCKGREYSQDELVTIGKKWLSEMGYDGLPTMIYFHNDTPNNHIHIITTRIGIDRKKINNDNERYRARTAINKIMNVDLKEICKKDFAEALAYRFDGIRQFEMILNAKGYKTSIVDDKIELYKEGNLLLTKSIDLIYWSENRNKKTDNNDAYKKRNRQIYSLFKKYRQSGNLQDFQKLMKDKFKISLVFFGKKDAPYGYAIVDDKEKRVIKGSDVLKLKELLISEPDRLQNMKDTIGNLIAVNKNINRSDIYKELRKWGALLIKNDVVDKSTKQVIFSLDEKQTERLNYNSRLLQANNYNVKNEKERDLLAKLFSLKSEDISIYNSVVGDDKDYYRDILIASENDKELLRNANIFVVNGDDSKPYIIDKDNNVIYSFEELNYQYSVGVDIINRRNVYSETKRDGIDDILDALLDRNDNDLGFGGADNRLKKRKRK